MPIDTRTCIIHIGTHKTGTTSQQYFLMHHAREFLSHGMLFPTTGWYGVVPGHHEIAWELFNESEGPLFKKLLGEIQESNAPGVILSAEDFSLLYSRPQALERLASGLRAIGYTPKILAYVRAQGPFAESMYAERIKHGDVRPLDAYVDDIVQAGCLTPNESTFPIEFHYTRLLAPFSDIFGRENIRVRAYSGMGDLSLAFSDFFESLGILSGLFQNELISIEVTHPLVNESLSYIRLLGTLFTKLRLNEDVPATATEFARKYAPDLPPKWFDQRYALLSRDEHLAILHSVAQDNRDLERLYDARVPFMDDRDVLPAGDPIWEKAALERTIYDRCLKLWSSEEQTNPNDR